MKTMTSWQRGIAPAGRRGRYVLSCALMLAAVTAHSAADRKRDPANAGTPKSAGTGAGFEAFQVIAEKNIFNPNRVGRTRAAPEEKPPRVDEIALVGVLQYDKGRVAFFDSPDSVHRKTVQEGDMIADFKVQRVGSDGVDLARDQQVLAMKVTQQLRRAEGGDWTLTAAPERTDARPPGAEGVAARPGEGAAPELPADASEVLKRLIKKREKQFKP